ncbi:hypothetical protein ACFSJU_07770 [Paradesertivirga mongoliensis]|uniref:Lipoprotein n=1 Tax=Paradesertivirga mongoliensis TaxID=2100740 RepID=A0ABW4ZK87_9SPHI|nr:hypothetical protein [Pedobacter mongoliensis]
MAKLLATIVFCNLFLSCISNTTQKGANKSNVHENQHIQEEQSDLKHKAEQLKKAYKRLSSSSFKMFEQQYFDSFPSSFVLLNGLFGYTDKEPMGADFQPGPLYDESLIYIEAFFKLEEIEKTMYYNRIIDISSNGKWYADGVSHFKHGMQAKLKADIESFCELLKKRTDKEIKGFWFFYFDGPHPPKKMPAELYELKQKNQRVYRLMQESFKEVL